MLTKAQADDIHNVVEAAVVAGLGADAWLSVGGTGGIKKIAQKYLPLDRMQLWRSILPGMAVTSANVRELDELRTAGSYVLATDVTVEYYRADMDVEAAIDGVQTALARLMRWAWDEMQGGSRLNGLLDTGGGSIDQRRAPGPGVEVVGQQRALHVGMLEFTVMLEVDGA